MTEVTGEMVVVGLRVKRGPDWRWNEQDHGPDGPGEGVITGWSEPTNHNHLWVRVKWDNSSTNTYRVGNNGKYDLSLADDNFEEIEI